MGSDTIDPNTIDPNTIGPNTLRDPNVEHIRIHPFCGACGEAFAFADRLVAGMLLSRSLSSANSGQ